MGEVGTCLFLALFVLLDPCATFKHRLFCGYFVAPAMLGRRGSRHQASEDRLHPHLPPLRIVTRLTSPMPVTESRHRKTYPRRHFVPRGL